MTVTPAAVFHRLVTLASRPSVMSIDPGFGDWLERHRSKILVIIEAAVNERGKKALTRSGGGVYAVLLGQIDDVASLPSHLRPHQLLPGIAGQQVRTLREAQRAVDLFRDSTGMGSAATPKEFGLVIDPTNHAVAQVSYNGRVWHVPYVPYDQVPGWTPGRPEITGAELDATLGTSMQASTVASALPPGPWDQYLDAARKRELVETSTRTALSPDTLWPIAVLYRAEWNIPWKAAFLSAADYLKTPRGIADSADVVLEHTVDGGTLFSRLDKDDRDIAKALGMQWSRREGFWYRNSSRGRQLPTVLLSRAVDLATKKGLTIALEIQEPPGLEAARAAHRAAKESRAEVYEARAAKHAAKSEAAYAAEHEIGKYIPLGQPILVGHHSEKRARKDIERMRALTQKWVDEGKASARAEAKAASVSAQADRYAPAQRSRLTTKGGFQEGTAGEVLALLKSRGKKDLGASGILQLKHKTTIYGFVFAFGPKPENEWMDRRRRVEITVSSREANIGNWYHSANGVKVPVGSRDAADVYADIVRAAKGWLERGGTG